VRWLRRVLRRLRRRHESRDYIFHTCGAGPIALARGEDCPFCETSWKEASRRQLESGGVLSPRIDGVLMAEEILIAELERMHAEILRKEEKERKEEAS